MQFVHANSGSRNNRFSFTAFSILFNVYSPLLPLVKSFTYNPIQLLVGFYAMEVKVTTIDFNKK